MHINLRLFDIMNRPFLSIYICLMSLILMLLSPKTTYSQDSDLGNWLIYIGNKKIDNKWDWHSEVQYRNYNLAGDLEQLLLRTGFGYTFNEGKNNVLLGYGYILSENYLNNVEEKVSVNEHRIFQQFLSKQAIGRVKLNHRYRFEQRFVESDFKLRFRYFLGLNIPLGDQALATNRFYVSIYNEIFLNSKSAIFDRNRLYGGLGYKMSDNFRIEAGYMNQFFERSSRDQLNILFLVNFNASKQSQ